MDTDYIDIRRCPFGIKRVFSFEGGNGCEKPISTPRIPVVAEFEQIKSTPWLLEYVFGVIKAPPVRTNDGRRPLCVCVRSSLGE